MEENEQKKDTPVKPQSGGVFRRMPAADVDLATDIRSTILIQSPSGGRFILWGIVLFFILAVIWAYQAEIEEVTRGMGKVIPSQQMQVIQNLEGGILAEVFVHEGQIVEKNQLLLRIDETRFSAPYRESRLQYLALLAKMARLRAETNDEPFVAPQEVLDEKPELATREQELYNTRQQALTTTLEILQEQATQQSQQLAELKAKLKELTRTYELLNRELHLTRGLISEGAVSEVEVLRLERQASQMSGEIETTKLSIPQAESRIKEALRKLKEGKLAYKNQAKEELNEAYARLEGVSASSIALMDRLTRTSVRSPVRGTVNQILVNTVGGIIQPGMDILEIVPLEDTLLIEAKIKPSDIAFLHPGQKAMVKFTAYDFTVYGGLEAELEHISADSITDEKGDTYYQVRVRTKQNYIGLEEDPLPIIPGMVAMVDILTGKKTILNYLAKPLLRAQKLALRER